MFTAISTICRSWAEAADVTADRQEQEPAQEHARRHLVTFDMCATCVESGEREREVTNNDWSTTHPKKLLARWETNGNGNMTGGATFRTDLKACRGPLPFSEGRRR